MENINIKPFEVKKVQKIVESRESQDLVDCISRLEVHAEAIGEGGNAVILAIQEGQFSKVCLKKIKEKPQLVCNPIDQENDFQGKARAAGVRTPLALVSLETDEGTFLIMEKVEGSNVEEVIKEPARLPESFNYELFCKDLDEQIRRLHDVAGIFHRDLHIRNVMINENGLPVIIDFGTATEGTGSDFTYEELANVYNEKLGRYEMVSGKFKDDVKMVQNLKSALRAIIKKSGIDN